MIIGKDISAGWVPECEMIRQPTLQDDEVSYRRRHFLGEWWWHFSVIPLEQQISEKRITGMKVNLQ